MAGFNNDTFKIETDDGRNIKILETIFYVTKQGEHIEIPENAESDGASTPRFLWRVIPPFGWYWRAAILHDYLYRSTYKRKKDCDKIFLEAMLLIGVVKGKGNWIKKILLTGVYKVQARLIYSGVRFFGFFAFRKCRKKLKIKGGNNHE